MSVSRQVRALSAEQLLAIADEFCLRFQVQVRSFAALVAAAAVPGARIHGVAVWDSAPTAAAALRESILRLEPLSSANEAFAQIAQQVYLRWVEEN